MKAIAGQSLVWLNPILILESIISCFTTICVFAVEVIMAAGSADEVDGIFPSPEEIGVPGLEESGDYNMYLFI